MDNSTISITNYGLPIPIELPPSHNIYIPEMIFGLLVSSSIYRLDIDKLTNNSIRVKVTNIFSTEFKVIIHDHIRKLKYTQVWSNNMVECNEPVVAEYNGAISSVQVVYKMDFNRFKYPPAISLNGEVTGGYPPEAFALFTLHAIDTSIKAKSTVTFNGQEFKYNL